ncbi:hypothetical protein GEMRC1_013583 [Eukaryota sp. GEM-RC1]
MNDLALTLDTGNVFNQDIHESIKYFQMAVHFGCSYGMYNFGVMNRYGDGLVQNSETALKMFQKSAQLSNAYGIRQLIYCFKCGIGTNPNLDQARYWEGKLQSAQHRESIDELKRRGLL